MSTIVLVFVAGLLAFGGWGGGWHADWRDRAPDAAGGAAGGTCLEGTVDCIDDPSNGGAVGPALGMCAPGVTDCVDVVVVPDGEVDCGADGCDEQDEFDEDHERQQARSLLGVAEGDLAADVRIARRGEETFAVTEDYRLGRDTVELDAGADGTYRVVSVTVELMDGPETFTTTA